MKLRHIFRGYWLPFILKHPHRMETISPEQQYWDLHKRNRYFMVIQAKKKKKNRQQRKMLQVLQSVIYIYEYLCVYINSYTYKSYTGHWCRTDSLFATRRKYPNNITGIKAEEKCLLKGGLCMHCLMSDIDWWFFVCLSLSKGTNIA